MRIFFVLTFTLLLLLPPHQAVFADSVERERLIAELNGLLVQLATLQNEFATLQSPKGQVLGVSARRLEPSNYYSGAYEAIYYVENGELIPYGNSVSAEGDDAIWKHWQKVVGNTISKKYFTEFRLYNDIDNKFDAFVEQIGETDDWILGVNLAGVSLKSVHAYTATTELFIHEYAHILHHYNEKAAVNFEEEFWTPRSNRSRDYVSDYAMLDVEEDFAESFMHYVLRSLPIGSREVREKVALFDRYRVFREERAAILERL